MEEIRNTVIVSNKNKLFTMKKEKIRQTFDRNINTYPRINETEFSDHEFLLKQDPDDFLKKQLDELLENGL